MCISGVLILFPCEYFAGQTKKFDTFVVVCDFWHILGLREALSVCLDFSRCAGCCILHIFHTLLPPAKSEADFNFTGSADDV